MGQHRLRRVLEPVIRRGMHFYWRFSRAATLGTRAMVIDGAGRIFLIKHTYVDGWHLPGGGVETGRPSSKRSRVSWLKKAISSSGLRRSFTASTSTGAHHGATTWRCSLSATSGRTETRSPTTKLRSTHSSRSTRFRKTQAVPHAPAWRKCLVAQRSASCGDV